MKMNYAPETINISEPPIGSVNEKRLGDELLIQGTYREHDAIHVSSVLQVHWAYSVHPGYYLKLGEDQEAAFYRIGGAGEESGMIQKAALADPIQSLVVKKQTNTLCALTVFSLTACGNDVRSGFESVKKPISTQDSIQRTLIYNGKVGNKINIGYREFSGSLARPQFSNSVEYDLGESKRIGYKGAILEILEATNQKIQYRVISNFNDAKR